MELADVLQYGASSNLIPNRWRYLSSLIIGQQKKIRLTKNQRRKLSWAAQDEIVDRLRWEVVAKWFRFFSDFVVHCEDSDP